MLIGAAALLLGLATPAAAQWQPNETRASPQSDLIDYEFSQARGMFAWNDCCGKLWIGKVDRSTGKFEPSDGKFMLIDPDSMSFDDAQKTKNGPEWVSTSIGDVIVYTRYSGRHIDANARIGYAFPMLPSSSCNYISADAYWCATNLGPAVARKAPYGSHGAGDPAPRISYVDGQEVALLARALESGDRASLCGLPSFQLSDAANRVLGSGRARRPLDRLSGGGGRRGPGVHARLRQRRGHPADLGSGPEVRSLDVVRAGVRQRTSFSSPWSIRSSSACIATCPSGPAARSGGRAVYSQLAPTGNQIFSPEPFVYAGKSYIFMSQTVSPNKFRSQVWIANIDAAAPIFKRITPLIPLQTRTDPEVFITDNGPYIYYNVLEPGTRPNGQPKPCRDPVTCSLGVWFADPGLKTTP